MELKAAYKSTDAGPIPSEWESVEYGSSLSITSGMGFKKSEYVDNGVKLLRIDNVSYGRISWDTSAHLPFEYSRKFPNLALHQGDILLALNRPITNGRLKIARVSKEDLPSILYQRVGRIEFINELFEKGFTYHLLCKFVKKFVEESSVGSDQPFISTRALKQMCIPRPPSIQEQRSIGEALSDADALIESLEQLLTKKRLIKQGVMQELLTGKRRLPGFRAQWETKNLGDLGQFLKGNGVSKGDAQSGHLPCVRYGEIYTRHEDIIRGFYSRISREVALAATRLKRGDLLFAGSGETKEEIGKCIAFVDNLEAYAGGDIVILRTENCDPTFLGYYLNTDPIRFQKASKGQGDAVVHISASALATIQISTPILAEQTAIAQILNDIDAEIATLDAKVLKSRLIKQGMMQQLLTGKIRLI